MNRFDRLLRWAWSILVVCTLAFALGGCEGDDGRDGAAGTDGTDGQDCWDLNGNGVGDLATEDLNVDGVVDVLDCNASANTVAAAIEAAQVESCATCHGDAADHHQGEYDKYTDPSTLGLTFDDLTVTDIGGGDFLLELDFSITKDGAPYIDPVGSPPSFDSVSFYVVNYDSGTGEFANAGTPGFGNPLGAGNAASNGDGSYTLTQTIPVDPTAFGGGAIMGRIAHGLLDTEDDNFDPTGTGRRVQMYADLTGASWLIGDMGAYESAANVEACEACHGAPYNKHGNNPGTVAGAPDFNYCRGCHNDTTNGGHPEWQHMVDNPFAWATGVARTPEEETLYAYDRTLLNDVHMSHAMEFPYPQSMVTCNTCHAGKLAQVLDDSQFTAATCQSCHVPRGIDSWPKTYDAAGDEILDNGNSVPGPYYQPHRPPAMAYLWKNADVDGFAFHNPTEDCNSCHKDPADGGFASRFTELHSGFDSTIYDATGLKYSGLFPVSIDSVSMADDVMTVEFSADAAVVPELLVSFYGWDSKHFIVGSHERDANVVECPHPSRPGCKMEYVPESSNGGANPLFTEDALSVPGAWIVHLDVSLLQLTKTDLLPTLIANGDVTKAEISITPELNVGGTDVVLEAVSDTFDIAANAIVATEDYFAGANATVDIAKCNACHDVLASTFHAASGRGGDGMQVCKACHTTTFPGSHLEMASRSIDSYAHAIHSFQPFDLGSVNAANPVEVARTEQHMHHKFPYFTALACEGCHMDGTYNVPDQSQSMPGVLAATDDIPTRNIGAVPEYVTGPASRACGGCHRAVMINEDHAGELASFNAHTDAFGTYVKNDTADTEGTSLDDEFLFGIIEEIMTWFE
ncbi:MAG: hypothetical protein OES10_14200 [Gammaproteobacteria bacterium]|jgi:OmcA/MtrC family decaheme c-type cytochrome|nr:hypothetical protein [Gammaproteobacteria bacterium]MDH3749118.1 hypothetical protein [Gammaproteobacteria bacterium]